MKIVVTGATGFIGSVLVDRLVRQNSLTLLSRKPMRQHSTANKEWVVWQPGKGGEWEQFIGGADGVINLAGEPIAGKRWTAAQKEELRASRINATRSLIDAIGKAKIKPKFLLSSSAVGYYGPHGDEIVTEETAPASDFLGSLCVEWEALARQAETHGVRVVLLRTGIVLGKGKGALAKMVPPFKMFVGGPLGSGRQWLPWIHVHDHVGLITYLMENEHARGAFNLTAPNPVTMEDFSIALGGVLNRPSWATVPAFALSIMLGEMADMLLNGQRAVPQAALKLGYHFRYPTIADALKSLDL